MEWASRIYSKQRPQRDNETGNTWLLLDSGMVPLSELTWLERESSIDSLRKKRLDVIE